MQDSLNSYCKGCDQFSAPHRRRDDGQWVCEDCGHLVECSDPQWSDNCDDDLLVSSGFGHVVGERGGCPVALTNTTHQYTIVVLVSRVGEEFGASRVSVAKVVSLPLHFTLELMPVG